MHPILSGPKRGEHPVARIALDTRTHGALECEGCGQDLEDVFLMTDGALVCVRCGRDIPRELGAQGSDYFHSARPATADEKRFTIASRRDREGGSLLRGSALGASKRKAGQVVLVIEDTGSGETAKLVFDSWQEAHEHVRQVILGQIIEELANIGLQDAPSEWKSEIEELMEIGKGVNYPRDEGELRAAAEEWKDYVSGHTGFTVVEVL
jgi:hypothetical protein